MGRRTKIPLEIIFYTLSFLIILSMYKGCYTIEGAEGNITENNIKQEINEKKEEIEALGKENLQAQEEEGCEDELCEIAQKYKETSDISLANKRSELISLQESLKELTENRIAARKSEQRAEESENKATVANKMTSDSSRILAGVRPALKKIEKIRRRASRAPPRRPRRRRRRFQL